MQFTDDPYRDFTRYQAEIERELKKLPTCAYCGEPIQDDECYAVYDDLFCPECFEGNDRKRTEDYYRD